MIRTKELIFSSLPKASLARQNHETSPTTPAYTTLYSLPSTGLEKGSCSFLRSINQSESTESINFELEPFPKGLSAGSDCKVHTRAPCICQWWSISAQCLRGASKNIKQLPSSFRSNRTSSEVLLWIFYRSAILHQIITKPQNKFDEVVNLRAFHWGGLTRMTGLLAPSELRHKWSDDQQGLNTVLRRCNLVIPGPV